MLTELGNAANRKLENHESTVFGIIDERFDGQVLNAFLFLHSSRGDICVNLMLKVLVLVLTTFGLLGISIPLAFAGNSGDPEDYETQPISRDAIQRSLPANPISVLDIDYDYEIGEIVQAPRVIQQAPRVIQPPQPANPINFGDLEGYDDGPIIQTPKDIRGLQPVVDLEDYL